MLSALARAQYGALARLRWRVFVNGLRSSMGVFELGARTVSFVLYGLMGLGFGAGAGAVAYGLASDHDWQYMPIEFWVVWVMWQVVPIVLASFQDQFDLSSLLRFPVGFQAFVFLYVVFGLSDVSTILGGLCCLGILVGVTIAQPGLFVWTALVLLLFAAFNILLVRAVFAWIDRWLAQRKTREILAAIFMVLVLSVQLMNPAVWQHGHKSKGSSAHQEEQIKQLIAEPWVRTVVQVQAWVPPGLAGNALRNAAEGQKGFALEGMAVLGLFVIGAGSVLGLRLRGEYRGENLNAAPARKKVAASAVKAVPVAAKAVTGEGLGLSGPIAAVIEKELRSLMRTLPLLYAVGAPLVLILIFSGSFLHGNGLRGAVPIFAFPLCVFFAQIGFRQLFSNSLGTEGAGVQLYFLSPVPMRTVLLAKNLLHAAVFVVAMTCACLLAEVRLGPQDGLVVAITIVWLLLVLILDMALGNIFSLTMPYKVNPGRLSRQRGSQASGLIGLALEVGTLALGAAVFEACSYSGKLWVTIPVFLVMTAIAVFLWLKILGNADELARERKEHLILTLMKAE